MGQYSDEVPAVLNDLQQAGRIVTIYDGPSARIRADVSPKMRARLSGFFDDYFQQSSKALVPAFRKWAYMDNDTIITRAHDDPSYKKTDHGEPIFSSFAPEQIAFKGPDDDEDGVASWKAIAGYRNSD